MAKRQSTPAFDSLWDAIRDGTAADVRALIAAAGGAPEDREERGDPTPLMYAAALGQLDVVQTLVEAGASANEMAEYGLGGDLPDLPFLDDLLDSRTIGGLSALGYAAAYGRDGVVEYLRRFTSEDLKRDAELIARARGNYLAGLTDKEREVFLKKCERRGSTADAERRAIRREHPKLSRWIVDCHLCGRPGYETTMPTEIDRQGTAARVRRLFRPLSSDNLVCTRCQSKLEKAERKAEALVQKQLSELPSHAKIEVVELKPKKKRPSTEA